MTNFNRLSCTHCIYCYTVSKKDPQHYRL